MHMPYQDHEQVTLWSRQSKQCSMAKSKFVVNWCEFFGNRVDAFSCCFFFLFLFFFCFCFFATHCYDEFVPVRGKNVGKWKKAFSCALPCSYANCLINSQQNSDKVTHCHGAMCANADTKCGQVEIPLNAHLHPQSTRLQNDRL